MKTNRILIAVLGLGLMAGVSMGQEGKQLSDAELRRSFAGKVPRMYSKVTKPKLSRRKTNFSPLVADPALAEKLTEQGSIILSTIEYEELKERKSARMSRRFGRSLSATESASIDDYESESRKRTRIVQNEDADDDSLRVFLWLIGGVAAIASVFYFWRRHL